MKGILSSLVLIAVVVLAIWLIGQAFGFEIALIPSLVISVVLTLVLSLVLRGFRTRRPVR